MPRTVFRVFLSSTFGDFQAEREKLRIEVWPRLEKLCAAHGASFHVVDLRWGIPPLIASNQETLKVCLDEVHRCQSASPRPKPNFIMLIGDRYGWRPPAVTVPEADWVRIVESLSEADRAFLESWYQQDTNATPPVWCLKPREGAHLDIHVWRQAETRLTSILHQAARLLVLPAERYLYSATHMEIAEGLLRLKEDTGHIFAFRRQLSGLPDQNTSGLAYRYADYLPDGMREPDSVDLQKILKEQVEKVLPSSHLYTYQAHWQGHEPDVISLDHLDAFCTSIEESLRTVIAEELKTITQSTPMENDQEIQAQFLEENGKLVIGREKELEKIIAYIHQQDMRFPLVIQARGGAGKSVLMAGTIHRIKQSITAQDPVQPVLVYRFIGASPRSWQIMSFFEDLMQEIARAYGQSDPQIEKTSSREDQSDVLQSSMSLATKNQPLIMCLDGIDQFGADHLESFIRIMPAQLPKNVKLILSILRGPDSDLLARHYAEASVINLDPLSSDDFGRILDARLSGRTLTSSQRASILAKATSSGLPLWLSLAAPIARELASWENPPEFPGDIKAMARHVINRIAKKHGQVLTLSSIRYIKLARFGLSETELQQILWADPDVRAEFEATKNSDQPAVDALPPILWSRLYNELDPYINEYWMDGQLLHRYFHRVFGEVADEMDESTRKVLHGRLADWFKAQPLRLDALPNGRKLMELPGHLVLADRISEAQAIVANFDFGMAKCQLNRSDDWVEDVHKADNGKNPDEFKEWYSFIRTNSHILRRGTHDWPADRILLQLASEYTPASLIARSAESWLDEGKCTWVWIKKLPTFNVSAPKDFIFKIDSIEDPRSMALLSDGCFVSFAHFDVSVWDKKGARLFQLKENRDGLVLTDGKILTWLYDTDDGQFKVLNTDLTTAYSISIHSGTIHGATLLSDGNILSWSDDGTLAVWEPGGTILRKSAPFENGIKLTASGTQGNIFFCTFDNTIRLWNNDNTVTIVKEPHNKEVKTYGDNVRRMVTYDQGKLALLWEEYHLSLIDSDGKQINELSILPLPFNIVEGPDGTLLVCNADSIEQWDSNGDTILRIYKGHTATIWGALVLLNGNILSWSHDATLRLWSPKAELLAVYQGHNRAVERAIELSDNRVLSCGEIGGDICVWDIGEIKPELTHTDNIQVKGHLLTVHPDGRIITYGGDTGEIGFWDRDGCLLNHLHGHRGQVKCIDFFPNGDFISCDSDSIVLWTANGEMIRRYGNSGNGNNSRITVLSENRFLFSDQYKTWFYDTKKEHTNAVVSATDPCMYIDYVVASNTYYNKPYIEDDSHPIYDLDGHWLRDISSDEYREIYTDLTHGQYKDYTESDTFKVCNYYPGKDFRSHGFITVVKKSSKSESLLWAWHSEGLLHGSGIFREGLIIGVDNNGDIISLHLMQGNTSVSLDDIETNRLIPPRSFQ